MEGPLNGIRSRFFRDLTEDYLRKQKKSFLYRDFWSENMQKLLQEHFPELLEQEPPKPEGAKRLTEQVCESMKARPEWAGGLLLRKVEKGKLWQALWLNDAGYKAGLITDSEYYMWLVEYLAAHDFFKIGIYYGTFENRNALYGYPWVGTLLRKGLGKDVKRLKEEIRSRKRTQDKDERRLSKAETDEALLMLAEQIREDRETVAGRLHDLDHKGKDYLPLLTARLERLALHIDIREWLQNSGYPLKSTDEKSKPQKARKKEVTWRRFTVFCDSADGYDFRRKSGSGWKEDDAVPGNWYVDDRGFCVLDTDEEQLKKLMAAHEKALGRKRVTRLYIPLAVHTKSGCVFFLAGKSYYEKVYQEYRGNGRKGEELWAKFQAAKGRYCFDYLRQDPSAFDMVDDERRMIPSFRLMPSFHDRVVSDDNEVDHYKSGLDEFMSYCEGNERRDMLHTVREYNESVRSDFSSNLLWAFDDVEL